MGNEHQTKFNVLLHGTWPRSIVSGFWRIARCQIAAEVVTLYSQLPFASRKRLCSVSLIFIHKQEKLFTVQLFYVYVVVTVHLTRSSNYPSIFTKATMRRNRLLPCVKTDVAIKRAFQRKLPILFAAETNSRHCKPIDCH